MGSYNVPSKEQVPALIPPSREQLSLQEVQGRGIKEMHEEIRPTEPPSLDPPPPNRLGCLELAKRAKARLIRKLQTKSFSVAAPILAGGRLSSVLFI